jgi:hypothetical protein
MIVHRRIFIVSKQKKNKKERKLIIVYSFEMISFFKVNYYPFSSVYVILIGI